MQANASPARDAFTPLRRELPEAAHAPGYIYTSEAVLRHEIEHAFLRDWLYAGRVEEVEQPGDYITLRLVDESIIITRDHDGELQAFYNMCAHRGPEIAQGRGNARSFMCPYHGWTYDLQGQLRGAAHMGDTVGFDKADVHLRRVALQTWRGNIFVCFAEQAPDFDAKLREFEQDFGFLQLERCRLGNRIELEVACNWKLVHENLMDFYHVNVLHVKSFGSRFKWSNDNVVLKDDGGMSIWYSGSPSTPGGEPLLGKMPWLEDRDYTLACTGFMPPNCTIFGRIDNQKFFVTWPITASTSRVIIYQLFSDAIFSHPDKEKLLKIYGDFQILILEEDRTMIESMQKALASRTFVPGRMSVLEKSIHHTLNNYVNRLDIAGLEPSPEG